MNRLITVIRDSHMGKAIGRYKHRNCLVSEEEIESEFLLGCFKAVEKADLEIGNPLRFITWKGRMSVVDLLSKKIRKGVRGMCHDCGEETKITKKKSKVVCPSCAAPITHTWMVQESLDEFEADHDLQSWEQVVIEDTPQGEYDRNWMLATWGIQIEEMRARLGGRVLQLFDILILEGINRDSSQNYQKEIAERWGCTTAAVSVYLRKLRAAVLEYVEG